MPLTGNSFTAGISYYPGDPSTAATAAFDVTRGTLVLDTTNGILYQKIAAKGTNTAGYARVITGQAGAVGAAETKFCTTQFDAVTGTTGATLTNVVGLTGFTLTAAGVYRFEVNLAGVSTANCGMKLGFGLTTATLTDFEGTGKLFTASAVAVQHTTTATSGMTIVGATAAYIYARLVGRITVNAAGTLAVQAAQNAAHADTTSIYVGSSATLTRVS